MRCLTSQALEEPLRLLREVLSLSTRTDKYVWYVHVLTGLGWAMRFKATTSATADVFALLSQAWKQCVVFCCARHVPEK